MKSGMGGGGSQLLLKCRSLTHIFQMTVILMLGRHDADHSLIYVHNIRDFSKPFAKGLVKKVYQ